MGEMDERFSLRDRRVLITGANRGIGRTLAGAFAELGARMTLLVRTEDTAFLDELEARTGARPRVLLGDLSSADRVAQLAAAELSEMEFDVLVNNAGVFRSAPALEVVQSDWEHVMELNLNSAWRLAQAVGRGMVARGAGKIISIASLMSFQGGRNVASYTVSKHGVLGLTRALASEWAGLGVNVNAIVPGYLATDNTARMREDAGRSAAYLARIPAGRWGTPEDLVGPAVFLASAASDYVHGHALTVDGGWLVS